MEKEPKYVVYLFRDEDGDYSLNVIDWERKRILERFERDTPYKTRVIIRKKLNNRVLDLIKNSDYEDWLDVHWVTWRAGYRHSDEIPLDKIRETLEGLEGYSFSYFYFIYERA